MRYKQIFKKGLIISLLTLIFSLFIVPSLLSFASVMIFFNYFAVCIMFLNNPKTGFIAMWCEK